MAQITVPIEMRLSNAWLVQPGDKLILGFAYALDDAELAAIKDEAASMLPGVEVAVFTRVSHMAVYRPAPVDAEGHLTFDAEGHPFRGLCHCDRNEAHVSPGYALTDDEVTGALRVMCPSCGHAFTNPDCTDAWHGQ